MDVNIAALSAEEIGELVDTAIENNEQSPPDKLQTIYAEIAEIRESRKRDVSPPPSDDDDDE